MAPIIDLFDFVLSKYFNEFLKYQHIKQLKLPHWFLLLVAIFVVLISYWIILVANGLKHGIYRYVIGRARNQNIRNANQTYQQRCNRSNASDDEEDGDEDDFYESSSAWVHINPRKSTNRNSSNN